MSVLRVRNISTAGIAKKTWAAIRDSGNVVSAVGSRDQPRAQAWVDDLQRPQTNASSTDDAAAQQQDNNRASTSVAFPVAPVAFGSYQEVLESDLVDCVYVPVPTALRSDIILAALRSGKHVVCEKPVATSMAVVAEMLAEAQKRNLCFCDGTMLTHGKRIAEIRNRLSGGGDAGRSPTGDVTSVSAVFTFPSGAEFAKTNIRCDAALEPLGALGDVGWYCIRYAIEAFGAANLRLLRAKGDSVVKNDQGVNMSFGAALEFELADGGGGHGTPTRLVHVQVWCSFLEAHQQTATFRGPKGSLTVEDLCLPFLHPSEVHYTINRNEIAAHGVKVDHTKSVELVAVQASRARTRRRSCGAMSQPSRRRWPGTWDRMRRRAPRWI